MRAVIAMLYGALREMGAGNYILAADTVQQATEALEALADEEERGQLSSERVAVSCPLNPEPHTLAECLAAEHERSRA